GATLAVARVRQRSHQQADSHPCRLPINGDAMIELYAFPTPNGRKITIALEEMGLEYRIIPINIQRGDQFMPEFLAFSPNNRIPAIIDRSPTDGGDAIPVFESGAILV